MHSSRIVITHFNQARKNERMKDNETNTKQKQDEKKNKINTIKHSNSAMWIYLMQNLRKSAYLFCCSCGCCWGLT